MVQGMEVMGWDLGLPGLVVENAAGESL